MSFVKQTTKKNHQSQALFVENEDAELLPLLEKKGYRTTPIFFVNGQQVDEALAKQARPNMTLLTFLRTVLHLTGSKLGCAEGGCGACTVMISKTMTNTTTRTRDNDDDNGDKKKDIQHYSVNACLMPVLAADGCHVTTVEGVGSVKKDGLLHPVQQAMVDMHGSQCGFCTPGIIVSLYTLLSNHARVEHLEEHLDGNLCRCTGYRPIWDAARSLCVDNDDIVKGPCGTPCRDCPERDDCTEDCNVQDKATAETDQTTADCCCTSTDDKMATYKDTFLKDTSWLDQPNRMFPAELMRLAEDEEPSVLQTELQKPLVVVDRHNNHNSGEGAGTWIQPTTLIDLLTLLDNFANDGNTTNGNNGNHCKLVVGNTEVGIEVRFKHSQYQRLIAPSHAISELFQPPTVVVDDNNDNALLQMGSCCPLSTIQQTCLDLTKKKVNDDEQSSKESNVVGLTRTCQPMHDMLRWFASTQIRNVACLGGNLVTASPISDMNPLLASMGATLVLSSKNSGAANDNDNDDNLISRRTCAVSDFFVRYRTVQLQQPREVVERIDVPVLAPVLEYVYPFKQAKRREDDISIVTAGMKLRLVVRDNQFVMDHVALAFGGMAPTTVMAKQTAAALLGKPFCAETFDTASNVLLEELKLPEIVPGGQAAYRMTLAVSFLRKFYLSCAIELQKDVQAIRANPALYPQHSSDALPEPPALSESEKSGTDNFLSAKKPHFTGTQTYPVPRVVSKGLEEEVLPQPPQAMAAAQQQQQQEEEESGAAQVVVGKAVTHQSGPLHCTGEALYVDDIPTPPGTLHASLVLSKECGRVLESVAVESALATPGVVGVFTHDDLVKLGGSNTLGPIQLDEVVFLPVGEVVRTVGQVLGICVAETLQSAELGARRVQVEYNKEKADNADKIIVSIADAIEAGSFYDFSRHSLERGDVEALNALESTPDTVLGQKPAVGDLVKVSGEFHSGAQEHFYLEPNGSLVVPSEADTNLTIYCSSQAPTKTQTFCATATGTPAAKVVVRVKRMGGGFGGKETRSVFVSAATAVASKILCRPVKCILPRDVDMKITGTRHAFLSKYHATARITADGSAKVVSLDVKMYNNGGCAFDLSGPVMDRALFHVDGCYQFPNFRCEGVVCKTVQPPHTAYRGFGGPQGMAANEHVMEHLALACQVPIHTLRRTNLYQPGDVTHFGMILGEQDSGRWNIPDMWDRMETELDLTRRRQQIDSFNAENTYLKRGISLIPTKFGIAYTAKYMNQGGALVHLYTDGSVLVSHGGTEMGQGLHTKVCQVAAQAFGIPIDKVYINDSSTDKVANTIPTAASMSTDTYGMATLDACRQILARLAPIQQEMGPNATLAQVAKAAFMARIDLSAHGFFAVNDTRCGFDWAAKRPDDFDASIKTWNSWKGHPFNYFTQGVACTEVEVDLLTGNHRTLQTDLYVDVGSSINPAIDIGQIEGAFTQGVGWCTMEDVVYGDDDHTWIRPQGSVFTTGPGTYKIPAFNDTPEVFNVTLLDKVDNPFAVHSSKAIGEPPFYLGASVFFAIKDAVISARKQTAKVGAASADGTNGNEGTTHFEMRMPATSERIRMYAADRLVAQAVKRVSPDTEPWFQPQGSY